ncbi:MAG: TetR/AcrR family transcriptional regulator [Acidimicrobiales bacterium]
MARRSTARTVRERAREELTNEIKEEARRQLAEHGADALSLRAISRELGMVSSALYRYFASRDALLTALIIDAYNALGDACEQAEAAVERDLLLERWRSIALATRRWAIDHPHEYALIYGTPVPGFAAPDDTIDPATRVPYLMLTLLVDIDAAVGGSPIAEPLPVDPLLAQQLEALVANMPGPVDQARLLQGLGAWAMVFGMINFELFGTFKNTFDEAEPLFRYQVDLMARHMGLVG